MQKIRSPITILFVSFSMDCIEKQRFCIEFCFKLGKTASELYQMLKQPLKKMPYHNRGHLNGLHDLKLVEQAPRMIYTLADL
ncbi:hypothetical protein LAZ67_1007102 [Cordylochernes scorpioides]|uniref:Uncharacterized protein n=1 Tax=Cordylochernes scorpioides TaxID=51811 RepID=A0ABY6K3Z0_9ARAC|nr:hypothetical protein LAZ67_1007102 [Cordylochernes scorpioides]